MSYLLEVCADCVQSAIAAQEGGADRIELCSGLVIGGLSPSPCLFKEVKQNTDLKVRVLLRPRFGDFCYDDYELRTIREEVQMFRELGADGVVIGILRPDGTINLEEMEQLVKIADGIGITMHRAFDVCRDPYEALEQCAALGIDTILTSGQESSARKGRGLLAGLHRAARGRIQIMAGAGVGPEVIEELAPETGIRAWHMSGKVVKESQMEFRREGVPMGIPGFSEFEIWQTDAETVRKAANVLQTLEM